MDRWRTDETGPTFWRDPYDETGDRWNAHDWAMVQGVAGSVAAVRHQSQVLVLGNMAPRFQYYDKTTGGIEWHRDEKRPHVIPPTVAIAWLSEPDEYEGGELDVDGMDGPLRPAAGSIAVFGGDVLHRLRPVTAGERVTLVMVCRGV